MKQIYLFLTLLVAAFSVGAQNCPVTISTFPYFQNFDNGPGGWIAGGSNSSWTLGSPSKSVINAAASGTHAWVTNLSGTYNPSEASFVTSPCFNMTSLSLPVISFKIWWEAENNYDKAVLQASTNGGTSWSIVGAFGDPDNWYNNNSSNGMVVGQSSGWSGTGTTNGSNGYVTAKHLLNGLGGQANVQLRIAFEEDGIVQYDGIAFDDFSIFESPANDVELVAITAPAAGGCGFTTTESVSVSIKNLGSAVAANFPVSYKIGSNPAVTETFSGSIAPGTTAPFTFSTKADFSTVGTYTLVTTTLQPNDGNPGNNSITKTITVVPTVSTFPYFQNFENGPGSWLPGGTNSSWTLGTPAKSVINSAGSGINSWVTNLTGNYSASEDSYVNSPCFNMSALVQPIISFKIWWDSEGNYDKAILQSSVNGGTSWQKVGAFGDPNNWYNNNSTNGTVAGQPEGWSGTGAAGSGGWVIAKHALTALGGQSSVMLRIAFKEDGIIQYNGIAFDDVAIFESPANDVVLVALTSPTLNGCGFSSTEQVCINITNFGSATATNIPVSYQIGNNPVVNETVTVSITPGQTITYCFTTRANLSLGGNYNFTISAALPNDGDPSNNTLTQLITNPLIATFPHTQDFENSTIGSPGVLPTGWTMAAGTGSFPYRWEVENDQPSSGTGSGPAADHTTGLPGTGKFVYTESSNGNTGDITYLYSPCIELAGMATPGFEFWYHMHGANTGTMEAEVSANNGVTWTSLTTISGPQQTAATDPWLKRVVTLASYSGTVRIRFKATRGSGFESDMAIDDVRFYNIGAVDLGVVSFTPLTKVCGFSTTEPVTVKIDNFGGLTATGFTMSYTINGGPAFTQNFTGTLAPNAPTAFMFTQGADLSAPGTYTIVVTISGNGDPNATNNTITYQIANATFAGLPPVFDFETASSGIAAMRTIAGPKATITEGAGASFGGGSTKGMIMSGVTNPNWQIPAGTTSPWTVNPEHLAGAYICFSPTGGSGTDSLWLMFDLKQLYKTANANTNFRVTVDGQQVGPTYRPPFNPANPATPIVWQKIKIDLTAHKNKSNIQIGLESSVAEPYANGNGPANLIDNVVVVRRINSTKDNYLNAQLNVFPNPSKGTFRVELPTGKAYELEVTDITGKTIKTQKANGGESLLNLNVPMGVYLLKVASKDGIAVRKLIVE